MAIEGLTPEQILKRELETGVPVRHKIGADSRPLSVDALRMIIRELTSAEYDAAVPRLAGIRSMRWTAPVHLHAPLGPDVAEAYWKKQKPDVASGEATLFVADENGVIVGLSRRKGLAGRRAPPSRSGPAPGAP